MAVEGWESRRFAYVLCTFLCVLPECHILTDPPSVPMLHLQGVRTSRGAYEADRKDVSSHESNVTLSTDAENLGDTDSFLKTGYSVHQSRPFSLSLRRLFYSF